MNTLREALQEYLALRRGLGFKMHDAGLLLPRFVAFMEEHQALHITTRLALEWVQQAKTVQPAERARRLCFIRGFARYRSATDPLTEVPSPEALAVSIEPGPALPVHRARSAGLVGGGAATADRVAVDAVAALGLSLPSGFAQRHGSAHLRSARSEARRCRSRARRAHDPGCQARSIPSRAPSSIHTHCAGPTTFSDANSFSARAARTTCSFPIVVRGSTSVAFIEPSTRCRGKRACGRPARATAPGCTTSGTALRFKCSPDGTSWARTRATTAGAVDLPRARVRGRHLLVSQQLAGTDDTGDGAAGAALGRVIMTGQPTFSTLLEGFFTQRLMQQRQASAHTIASYRDTFRLLLQFAQKRLRRAPSTLALGDIDAPLVVGFLDELEKVRDVTARTRNLRLTAIHSFFRYVAFEAPEHAAQIQRVLAIPAKRFARALVPFLSRQEVDALLAAPDQRTWSGRRDHALILLAVQTGLRLSELTGLRQQDLHLGTGAHVRVIGKGRKERCTPLSKNTRTVLAAWVKEPL